MTSEFFFCFDQLNLLFLFLKKQVEGIEKSGLIMIEIVEIFEYKKNNNKY